MQCWGLDRISRVRMFLDLPDPLVRGPDPDPSIYHQAKIVRTTFIPPVL
jgi:hypothetical protein